MYSFTLLNRSDSKSKPSFPDRLSNLLNISCLGKVKSWRSTKDLLKCERLGMQTADLNWESLFFEPLEHCSTWRENHRRDSREHGSSYSSSSSSSFWPQHLNLQTTFTFLPSSSDHTLSFSIYLILRVSRSMAVSPYPTWSIDSIQRLISQIKSLEMS